MNNISEEKTEKINETKELVKKMNVDAVAQFLKNMQDGNYKIRAEQGDLKHIISQVTQDIAELKTETGTLKALGLRGNMGTGSTVHKKGEEFTAVIY
jgi:hypothetical protein